MNLVLNLFAIGRRVHFAASGGSVQRVVPAVLLRRRNGQLLQFRLRWLPGQPQPIQQHERVPTAMSTSSTIHDQQQRR